ncbi:MAG TPA: thiamine biosynthesis protein ThiS [Ruminococcus sp.]|nr:thiamine biosynthesis protein ThiS [Ruminococcus sp.]
MVRINGTEMDADGKTVSALLADMHYQPHLVAVECNEEIIPKSCYDETILKDGDTVEVVSFVGGG